MKPSLNESFFGTISANTMLERCMEISDRQKQAPNFLIKMFSVLVSVVGGGAKFASSRKRSRNLSPKMSPKALGRRRRRCRPPEPKQIESTRRRNLCLALKANRVQVVTWPVLVCCGVMGGHRDLKHILKVEN